VSGRTLIEVPKHQLRMITGPKGAKIISQGRKPLVSRLMAQRSPNGAIRPATSAVPRSPARISIQHHFRARSRTDIKDYAVPDIFNDTRLPIRLKTRRQNKKS
jgi:hypothetical protein